jgi:hypothetical protein
MSGEQSAQNLPVRALTRLRLRPTRHVAPMQACDADNAALTFHRSAERDLVSLTSGPGKQVQAEQTWVQIPLCIA